MRVALLRLNASIITSSSIKFSLTGGPVGCTTNTSAPRTLSWIWNHTSPSLKRARCARPTVVLSERAIASPSSGCAFPVKILRSRDMRSLAEARLPTRLHRLPRWLGRKDSNLRSGVQSPAPYHLATPQRLRPGQEASVGAAAGGGASTPPPEEPEVGE